MSDTKQSRGGAAVPTIVISTFLVASGLIFARSAGFEYDDSYIWFRYVENVARGHGASFNPGERHEGFSSVAWLLLGGATRALIEIDTRILLKLLGALAYASAVCVLICVAARAAARGGRTGWPGAVAAASVALFSLLIAAGPLWAVSGMETGLYALALALFVAAASGGGRSWLVSLAFALAFVSRIEALIFLPLPIAVDLLLWTRRDGASGRVALAELRGRMRERAGWWLRYGAGAAATVAAVTFLRYQYFGDFVPATVRFKAPTSIASSVPAGYDYLAQFVVEFPPVPILLFASAALVLAARRSRAAVAASLVVLGKLGFILWVGGDWMGFHRFVAPVVPLMGLVIALAIAQAGTQRRGSVWMILAGLFVTATFPWAWASYQRGWAWDGMGVSLREVNASIGLTLEEWTQPEEVIAVGDVGVIPYYAKRRIVDLHGLMDRYLVSYAGSFSVEGHADIDVDYVLSKDPACFVIIASGPFRTPAGKTGAYPLYDKILAHWRFRAGFSFVAERALVDAYFYQIWCNRTVLGRLSR
jgi:arabinofuranosyltransferase